MSTSPLGRVVEIAEPGRFLHKKRGFLVVQSAGTELGRIPLDDILAVIASAPGTSFSAGLIAALAGRGVPFVTCDDRYAPTAILFPLGVHHAQQRRLEQQVAAGRPLKKQLWTAVVRSKINMQAGALQQVGEADEGLRRLARSVRSGDPENTEAQAARRYWKQMFGPGFRRDRHADGTNALLNYGYTILRSATARAVAAAGLHPGVGIFHRHPNNAMPLADDLMEPFRPVVDLEVRALVEAGETEVSPENKRDLAAVLRSELITPAGRSPLSTAVFRLAQSVGRSFEEGRPLLHLPDSESPLPPE